MVYCMHHERCKGAEGKASCKLVELSLQKTRMSPGNVETRDKEAAEASASAGREARCEPPSLEVFGC